MKFKSIIIVILIILNGIMTGGSYVVDKTNNTYSNSEDSAIMEENTKQLLSIFNDFYDGHNKAKICSEILYSIGVKKITKYDIIENTDRVIVFSVNDEANKTYCTVLNAKTGFVGVVYENDINGKALYFKLDD